LLLYLPLGHIGIAIATSLAGWINAGLLVTTLVRRGQFRADAALKRHLPRIFAASLIMGAALWVAAALLSPWLLASAPLAVRISALAALVASGLVVLGLALAATGGANLRQIGRQLFKQRRA
ncbi:MAG: polysaccharide biosynthesis C-terminal domain-containing protein, partial [Fimbriimonadaceae bacterium]|nr:polysaccharide biosynthesis C-terminal domain-containing protein [Alphaproteobacteria bacterium]